MAAILVVDDEVELLKALCMILRSRGHQVTEVSDGPAAVRLLESGRSFDLLISDVRIGAFNGLDLLACAVRLVPQMPVVMITAFATLEVAVAAVKAGAFDFITKPFQTETLLATVQRALDYPRLVDENILLDEALYADWLFDNIVARSDEMRAVCRDIERLAPTTAPLWFDAEPGSGRRQAAGLVHRLSARRARPLISFDCGACAPDELERVIFGAADADEKSLVRQAAGGTLLLENSGALSIDLLQRVLALAQVNAPGAFEGRKPRANADIRLLLTTSGAPGAGDACTLAGTGAIRIALPPLRERTADLLSLIGYLVASAQSGGGSPWRLAAAAYEALERYDWPGNVAELDDVLRQAVAAAGGVIKPEHLPVRITQAVGAGSLVDQRALRREEMRGLSFREYIRRQQRELSNKMRVQK